MEINLLILHHCYQEYLQLTCTASLKKRVLWSNNQMLFLLSMQAGGIPWILQSDWFPEGGQNFPISVWLRSW